MFYKEIENMNAPCFLVIPLDARPVCHSAVADLARLTGIQVFLPPADLLGKLKNPGNLPALHQWMERILKQHPIQAAIVSLDLLSYGGLIPSRIGEESNEDLIRELEKGLAILKDVPKLYGFSSILRVPTYNNSEEEPEYWAEWGETLSRFSQNLHKKNILMQNWRSLEWQEEQPPKEVIKDFVTRRERNHWHNLRLLQLLQQKRLAHLVFCEDDRGEYGLNVYEADTLRARVETLELTDFAHVQTGADEVAHTLLIRALSESLEDSLNVFVKSAQSLDVMAKFDGQPLKNVIYQRIKATASKPVLKLEEADVVLIVHAPHYRMGDHGDASQADTTMNDAYETLALTTEAVAQGKAVVLVDVAYANGADPLLLKAIKDEPDVLPQLAGYAAWNTPGNAIGSALAMGLGFVYAQKYGTGSGSRHRKTLATRFLDDGVYQSHVRHLWRLSQRPLNQVHLTDALLRHGQWILNTLGLGNKRIDVRFPCDRTFECAIDFLR
jgi:hypothetical protein